MRNLHTRATKTTLGPAMLLVGALSYSAEPATVWTSTKTSAPPEIDGRIDDVWGQARPLTVLVREALGGGAPTEVILRALHTSDSLYVLAEWPDATRSDMRDPYIWNESDGGYQRPTTPDDQFALEFPLDGELLISMLPTTGAYSADVWHWKAGRSNLAGWVDDKRHIISRRSIEGAKEYDLGGHTTIYIARPMDEGTASYRKKPQPTAHVGDVIPSYQAQAPSGSLTDVRGKGIHGGKGWTLEMSRKFDTGNPDDAVIDPKRANLCAIAVLDDELYWDHSISQFLSLRFEPN